MERLAIMVGSRGRGSNMRALIEACQKGEVPADPCLVVSPNETAPATLTARSLNVPVSIVEPGEGYGERLVAALHGATVLCLAGFTRLLPDAVVEAFEGRVLNIHPSLLPKFGGKGMYGMRVHEAVIAAGERESGCTVHWVTAQYDEGAVIRQSRCAVLPEDTPDALAARVLGLEHTTYPEALREVILGRLS